MGGVSRGGRLALEEKLAAVVPSMWRDIAGAMFPPIELCRASRSKKRPEIEISGCLIPTKRSPSG